MQRYQSGQPISFQGATGIPGWDNFIAYNRIPGSSFASPARHGKIDPFRNLKLVARRPVLIPTSTPSSTAIAFPGGENTGYAALADRPGLCRSKRFQQPPSPRRRRPPVPAADNGAYQFGDVPRVTGEVRNYRYVNEDFSVLKKTPITEGTTLFLKIELLNAFNRHIFSTPNDNIFNQPGKHRLRCSHRRPQRLSARLLPRHPTHRSDPVLIRSPHPPGFYPSMAGRQHRSAGLPSFAPDHHRPSHRGRHRRSAPSAAPLLLTTLLLLLTSCPTFAAPRPSIFSAVAQTNDQASAAAQARILHAEGKLAEAADLLARHLATDPDDVSALVELARIRLDQSDRPAAETALTHALALSPNSPEANDLSGNLLASAARYPEAMDHFETTLAVAPADPSARAGELAAATALALQARSAGKPEAALLCLEHASQHLPGNTDLLIDAGLVAGELHLYRRADRAFTAALALDPNNPRALYAAGRIALEAGHLPEAERDLRAYLVQKPTDATAHFGLGHVLALELNDAAARPEFERSLALQPAQTESVYQLGLLAANAGDAQRAEAFFRRTLTRNPRHAGALTGIGEIAYKQHDYHAAEDALTTAIQAAPDLQPAHYYLGLTLARLGHADTSTRELDRARQLIAQQQSKAAPEASEAPAPSEASIPDKAPTP